MECFQSKWLRNRFSRKADALPLDFDILQIRQTLRQKHDSLECIVVQHTFVLPSASASARDEGWEDLEKLRQTPQLLNSESL